MHSWNYQEWVNSSPHVRVQIALNARNAMQTWQSECGRFSAKLSGIHPELMRKVQVVSREMNPCGAGIRP